MAYALPSREAPPPSPKTTVIALIDVDSFECQVWQRMFPEKAYYDQPCLVTDMGGRIVSLTAEAKALGITREMRRPEAERIAHQANTELIIFQKPNDRNKPDGKTTRYASWEIVDALKKFTLGTENITIESGGSDEFYLDLTEEVNTRISNRDAFPLDMESRTFLEGENKKLNERELEVYAAATYENLNCRMEKYFELMEEQKLIYGGAVMQEINNFIFSNTRFVCSVGVGSNKLMAKIGVTLNKPNGITILPPAGFVRLSKDIPIEKISGLGGKTGTKLKENFKITSIKELMDLELHDLEKVIDDKERAMEIYLKCRGISDEAVNEKVMSFEVSCGKNFQGKQINSNELLQHHVQCLSEEMFNERLAEELLRHKRQPSCVRANVFYTINSQTRRDRDRRKNSMCSTNSMTTSKEVQVNEPTTWSYTIGNLRVKNYLNVRDEVIERFVKEVSIPITAIRISRICLTAKGFREVKDNDNNNNMNNNR